ncbi:MAG: helix-turn-helix transcriptional regulator [Polyangiaceae bacterium]
MDSQELRHVVAQNIRGLAENKGISLNALADFAGVSRAQLYAVLAESAAPTTDWLAKVAAVLEVDPARLFVAPTATKSRHD